MSIAKNTIMNNESAENQARALAISTIQSMNRGFESSTPGEVHTVLPMLFSYHADVCIEDATGYRVHAKTSMDAYALYADYGMFGHCSFHDTKVCAFQYVPARMHVWVSGWAMIRNKKKYYNRFLTLMWGIHIQNVQQQQHGTQIHDDSDICDWRICEDRITFL